MATNPTTGARQRTVPGMVLHALWSAQTWRATVHVVTGGVVGPVGGVAVLVPMVLAVALAPTVWLAVAAIAMLLATNRALGGWQRSRFAAFLLIQIPGPAPMTAAEPAGAAGAVRAGLRRLAHGTIWRQVAYHLLAAVLGPVAGAMVVAAWSVGLALAAAPWYVPRNEIGLVASAALTVAGLALLLAAPWVARGLAMMDARIAWRLLGTSRFEELAHQVESLAASREGAVDAADSERRRIERDLHDGAQQRLTALAMNLGIARATLDDLSPAARDAIGQAHDEAKQALAELRDLVRGMHPAVLDDLGLDAALSGIAARSPVPVRLRVSLPGRAARDVEAAAYFVVSEALTNAARHARASQVDVTVQQRDGRLRISVVDDGCGGADPDRGTGLQGLASRVRSVDGTLHIDSPTDGPTAIVADLPCES